MNDRGHAMDDIEHERRKVLALSAIRQAFGTDAGEGSINDFVQHHLDELPGGYWQSQLGSEVPPAASVLGLLVLQDSWGEGDMEYFDFTLPGDVTDYLVSVHFDGTGEIDGMAMES